MATVAQLAMKGLMFVGAVAVTSLGINYFFGPSREQRVANRTAQELAELLKKSQAPHDRNLAKAEERTMANVRPGDVLGTASDPRLDPKATAEQKDAARREVNARMASVKTAETNKPVLMGQQRRRISLGDDCDLFAVSSNGLRFDAIEAVCEKTVIVGNDATTQIIGKTSSRNIWTALVGATISSDRHTMTIPLSSANITAVRNANYIIIPTQAGDGKTPIYSSEKAILERPPS
jgi:hypothetical protein